MRHEPMDGCRSYARSHLTVPTSGPQRWSRCARLQRCARCHRRARRKWQVISRCRNRPPSWAASVRVTPRTISKDCKRSKRFGGEGRKLRVLLVGQPPDVYDSRRDKGLSGRSLHLVNSRLPRCPPGAISRGAHRECRGTCGPPDTPRRGCSVVGICRHTAPTGAFPRDGVSLAGA
jgi:hypothetical protein